MTDELSIFRSGRPGHPCPFRFDLEKAAAILPEEEVTENFLRMSIRMSHVRLTREATFSVGLNYRNPAPQKVTSREEAEEWTRRFPNPTVGGKECEIEVLQLFELED